MTNKLLLVAKREYSKVIKKKSFWLSTLAFPIFIIIISFISGLSASSVEKRVEEQLKNPDSVILIYDQANIIRDELVQPPFRAITDYETGIEQTKKGEARAMFEYDSTKLSGNQINIYTNSKTLFDDSGLDEAAKNLLKQSILLTLPEVEFQKYNANYTVATTSYKDGVEIQNSFSKFIVPLAAVSIYFILITFATSYLLLSVSEEKENRMIETILSIMSSRQLIWGKILGQVGIVMTQLAVLVALGITGLLILQKIQGTPLPINLSEISITPLQLIVSILYLFAGFLIMANTMVGVGAAMPTYREAQSLSGIFVILSMFPLYLATIILFEPSGPISMFASYFPFTAPMILLFRNTLGELSLLETFISTIVLASYLAISFYLSFKLFELGSLEYHRAISLRQFFTKVMKRL